MSDSELLTLAVAHRRDETYRDGNLGGVRRWIESVNRSLKTTNTHFTASLV